MNPSIVDILKFCAMNGVVLDIIYDNVMSAYRFTITYHRWSYIEAICIIPEAILNESKNPERLIFQQLAEAIDSVKQVPKNEDPITRIFYPDKNKKADGLNATWYVFDEE